MPARSAPKRSLPAVENDVATRENLRSALLAWYDGNGRDLPWRVRSGRGEPYRVWLSEVMLQQTTAAAVAPYYAKFLALWPDVHALAGAPREAVLAAWAGLGYYARARNLHAAAQRLAHDGFPGAEAGWAALPGVGSYTAAAIAAICFDEATNVVDGNVERVIARLFAVETPLPKAKVELRALAANLVSAHRPGDWAQALMDLGAIVCTPKAPGCSACPWRVRCAAFAAGDAERYPRRSPKAARPMRNGAVFVLRRGESIWLVRRPERGLLAGMAGLPTTPWRARAWPRRQALAQTPAGAAWRKTGVVQHVFTHFSLALQVYEAEAADDPAGDGWWGVPEGLPSVFKKAVQCGRPR